MRTYFLLILLIILIIFQTNISFSQEATLDWASEKLDYYDFPTPLNENTIFGIYQGRMFKMGEDRLLITVEFDDWNNDNKSKDDENYFVFDSNLNFISNFPRLPNYGLKDVQITKNKLIFAFQTFESSENSEGKKVSVGEEKIFSIDRNTESFDFKDGKNIILNLVGEHPLFYEGYHSVYSEDSTKMLFYGLDDKSGKTPNYIVKIFDEELNLISSEKIPYYDGKGCRKISSVKVSNDGIGYLVFLEYANAKKQNGALQNGSGLQSIYKVGKENVESVRMDNTTMSKSIINLVNDEILISGYFARDNLEDKSHGSFLYRLDNESLQIISENYNDFPKEIIEGKGMVGNVKNNTLRSKSNGLTTIDSYIIKDRLFIVSVLSYETTSENAYFKYYYGEVVISIYSLSGEYITTKCIERLIDPGGVNCFLHNDQLYFLHLLKAKKAISNIENRETVLQTINSEGEITKIDLKLKNKNALLINQFWIQGAGAGKYLVTNYSRKYPWLQLGTLEIR